MANKEKFEELFEEMLGLAQVPLEEQEDEEEKPAEEPEAADKEPAEEKPEEEPEDEEGEEGELADEWKMKIGNYTLEIKWIASYKRMSIRFRGPKKYMEVPRKLIMQESYRKPFLSFLRKILNFMSTGQGE